MDVERDKPLAKRDHSCFAQQPQHPVDVDGTQPKRVSQKVLRQRTGIAVLSPQPRPRQALQQAPAGNAPSMRTSGVFSINYSSSALGEVLAKK